MSGALIVIGAVLIGMAYAATRGLDGAQTFIVCLFVWFCLQSLRWRIRCRQKRSSVLLSSSRSPETR